MIRHIGDDLAPFGQIVESLLRIYSWVKDLSIASIDLMNGLIFIDEDCHF